MNMFLPLLPSLMLLVLLLCIMWGDLRHRLIPNGFVLAVALCGVLDWLLLPDRSWIDGALRIGLMAGALGLFCIPFMFGWMGGGDVKLLSALALWCSADSYLQLLLLTSLCGLVLSLWALVKRCVSRTTSRDILQVPYGIAIGFAAIWVLCQPVINHFVAIGRLWLA